jgi:hypothetical protein
MRRQSIGLWAIVSSAVALLLPMSALAQEHAVDVPCDSVTIGITASARSSFYLPEPTCRKQRLVLQGAPVGNGEMVYVYSQGALFRFESMWLDKDHFVDSRSERKVLTDMVNTIFKDEPISLGQFQETSGWRLTDFRISDSRFRCVGFATYRDRGAGDPGYHKRYLGFFCTHVHSQQSSLELTTDEIDTLVAGLIIPP